ncbi:MAG: hypothetical protein HY651_09485 [Acidobacteria bacterium]|nr:hypothetical protein [Acidobacteriota bacterium]
MAERITLHLSREGSQVLGRGILKAGARTRSVRGTVVAYDTEGLWFQDERLVNENRMVLVKWNFIDAILSDMPAIEPAARREAGFLGSVENRE